MSFIPRLTSPAYLTVEFQPYGGVKGGGGRTPLGETDIPAHGRLEDDSRIEHRTQDTAGSSRCVVCVCDRATAVSFDSTYSVRKDYSVHTYTPYSITTP